MGNCVSNEFNREHRKWGMGGGVSTSLFQKHMTQVEVKGLCFLDSATPAIAKMPA